MAAWSVPQAIVLLQPLCELFMLSNLLGAIFLLVRASNFMQATASVPDSCQHWTLFRLQSPLVTDKWWCMGSRDTNRVPRRGRSDTEVWNSTVYLVIHMCSNQHYFAIDAPWWPLCRLDCFSYRSNGILFLTPGFDLGPDASAITMVTTELWS